MLFRPALPCSRLARCVLLRALLPTALITMTTAALSQPVSGIWTAWLDSPGGELHFGLELRHEHGSAAAGGVWKATLINADERIAVPAASFDGSKLLLDIGHYDSRITATVAADGRSLAGEWIKRRGPEQFTRMGFSARFAAAPRVAFDPSPRLREASDSTAGSSVAELLGRWRVQFESDDQPAAARFNLDQAGHLSGTFLTTTGDYRYLTGDLAGDALTLSCFDGAHAFLFKARLDDEGGLRGDFWSREAWHETWKAERDDDFVMPDGFALTHFVEGADLSALSFPDLDGVPRTLDDPLFAGRARVLQIFGSWCPNCHDASDLMVEFDERYREQGLSIVGLAFEVNGDLRRDAEQVRRYAARHGVSYPLLVAGLADKDAASAALPFLDKVRSYPTTVFLHGDGRVRAVYQGFSGPATGADHQALRASFAALIEELLGE